MKRCGKLRFMNNAHLQLVFLGQLIDNTDRATPTHGPVPRRVEEAKLVIRHDLDAEEARRVAACVPGADTLLAGYQQAAPERAPAGTPARASGPLTPFPELVVDDNETAVAVRPAPERTQDKRLELPSIESIRAARAVKAVVQQRQPRDVCCPNCGEQQSMRVMCRGCASFLELALRAQAERHAERKTKSRAGGFLALIGL